MSVTTHTLLEIANAVSFRCGNLKKRFQSLENPDVDTEHLIHCINEVTRRMSMVKGLPMMNGSATIRTVADHSDGYVTLVQGSTAVEMYGTTATNWTSDMQGRAFSALGTNAMFRIASVNPSASPPTIYLETEWPFDSIDGTGYIIAQDQYNLPSDFADFVSVSLEGPSTRSLESRAPSEIDFQRHAMRSSIIAVGTPTIYSKFEKSSTGNWMIELDPFPDTEMQMLVRYKKVHARMVNDQDIVPVPDESIDVLIRGVVALWKEATGGAEFMRAYREWAMSDLAEWAAFDQKGTDERAKIVPDDVMRKSRPSGLGGSDAYPLSFGGR